MTEKGECVYVCIECDYVVNEYIKEKIMHNIRIKIVNECNLHLIVSAFTQ